MQCAMDLEMELTEVIDRPTNQSPEMGTMQRQKSRRVGN